jgi:uncharacterized protein YqeY
MTLKEQINANYIKAFKSKNSLEKNLLSVVKGEIQTIEKNIGSENLSDVEVIKILNKTVKNLNETIIDLVKASGSEDKITSVKSEIDIIQVYLPREMSREEITQMVGGLMMSGVTNIGLIMKEFVTLQADRKIVSEVIKELMK